MEELEAEPISTEELRNQLALRQAEYDAIIDEAKTDSDEYAELLIEEKKLQQALYEIAKKKQVIENARYQRQAMRRQAENRKFEAEDKLRERERFEELEKQKASAFEDMVAYCRNSGFEWVKYAYPYQWEGAMTIAHYGSAILGDEAGLGKTLTAIMSMDMKKSKKILVVAPKDVVTDFALNIQLYAPHRNVIPVEGPTRAMRAMIKTIVDSSNEFCLVTNYESLWRERGWLEDVEWDDIYIDEAHNMKNENGLTFDAIDSFKYRNAVPMTATSILNDPKDLFTSLHIVDRWRFPNMYRYLNSYCYQLEPGKYKFREGGEKALIDSFQGRFIKRTYVEVGIKLPHQEIREVLVPKASISDEQMKIMQQIHNYNAIMLDSGEHTSITARIAVITRERQAATFPAGIEVKVTEKMLEFDPHLPPVGTIIFKVPEDTPSIKSELAVYRLKQMIAEGHRCVVFSQFKTFLADLETRLKAENIRTVRYDGDTNKAVRLAVKRDFLRAADGVRKTDYKYDVVLANYKTGGVGLTFTEATYTLCPDEEWNPAKNYQAYHRTCRIGQTEETLVEILRIEPSSIDMEMKSINERKKVIIEGFEDEIGVLDSLEDYFKQPIIEAASETKAVEELDDDLSWID